MRHLLFPLAAWAVVRAHLATTPLFGGEDPFVKGPAGDNWHHEGLTRRGAAMAGWTAPAINALAFHADYVDSYLYFPPWWLDPRQGGGRSRLQAVWSSRDELKKLHFDDLNTPDQVAHMWQRYFSGTVAGLLWAATSEQDERVRISMAHNVIGCSLHAVQDFYSHSNWIDDASRRTRTWHDVPDRDRARMPVWTGTYETADHAGHAPHGEFLYLCALFENLPSAGKRLMDAICASWSPLSGTSLCEAYDACEDGVQIPTPAALRSRVPPFLRDKLVFVKPGINLDSRWQAALGAEERDLDLSGAEAALDADARARLEGVSGTERTGLVAFETAYALAARASCQWLRALEDVIAPRHPAFWAAVKHVGVDEGRRAYLSDTGPWEDMAQLPYRFVTAGAYPPAHGADDDGWYVRLHVDTADIDNAGTNADIVAYAGGRSHVLNHAPPAHTGERGRAARIRAIDEGLAYDDHEQATSAAYVIGPFDAPPTSITLRNAAPDAGDVFMAALESLGRAVTAFFENVGTIFRSLVGWHPDYIATAWHSFDAEDLNDLPVGGRIDVTLRCHHRSEGKHDVRGYLRKAAARGVDEHGIAWRQYEVGLTDFTCRKEADSDRGTNSDEPFFLALVTPHGRGEPQSWRSGVYADVDSGEGPFTLGMQTWVEVPEQVGSITLAVAAWESDGEPASYRRNLEAQFRSAGRDGLDRPEKDFLVTLTEAFAAGWRPLRMQATAFRRGTDVEVISYAPHLPNRWLMGGESLTYPLRATRHDRVRAVHGTQGDCTGRSGLLDASLVGDLRGVVEVPRATYHHNVHDLDRGPRVERPEVSLTPAGGWKVRDLAGVWKETLRDRLGPALENLPTPAADPADTEGVRKPRRRPGRRRWDTRPAEPPSDEPQQDQPVMKLDEATMERIRRAGALRLFPKQGG